MNEQLKKAIEENNLENVKKTIILNGYSYVNSDFGNGTTTLTFSIRHGNEDIVAYILSKSADANQKETNNGCAPLSLAVYLGHLKIVNHLIFVGANIDITDPYGNTPLAIAVQEGHLDIANYLLSKGANGGISNNNKLSPLSWAIKENKLNVVELLLRKGVNRQQTLTDPSGNSLLVFAVQKGFVQIVQCLISYHADINKVGNDGRTSLAWAAAKGHLNVLEILIHGGANINQVCSDGNTALAIAVQNKHSDVVKYLVAAGANVCKVGCEKTAKTPLSWAVKNEDLDMIKWLLSNGAKYTIQSAFLDSIETGNLAIIQELKENGAIINLSYMIDKDSWETPLTKAVAIKNVNVTKYLIDNGVKMSDSLGKKETTYLIKFIEEDNFEMLSLLVENGAKLNVIHEKGSTPLAEAVRLENFEVMKYLVEKGVNVNYVNGKSLAPLNIAAMNSDIRTFQYLIDVGANISTKLIQDEKLTKQFTIYLQCLMHKIHEKKKSTESVNANEEATPTKAKS